MDKENVPAFNLTGHRKLWNGVVKFLENKLENDPELESVVDLEGLKNYILSKQVASIVSYPLNDCWACEYAESLWLENSDEHTCDFCPLQPEVCDNNISWFEELENIVESGLACDFTPKDRERAIELAQKIRDAKVKPGIETI